MTTYYNGTVTGPIELPVTAYHHHDVESLSDVSTICLEITKEASENQVVSTTVTKIRSRPILERKYTTTNYPEGGRRAWSVVLGGYLAMLASFGFMASIGVFQEYIAKHQLNATSESSIGWIFSMYVFLSFFGGLLVGPVFDLNGPFFLLIAGGFCLVLGILLMSFSTGKSHITKFIDHC
jgi:hypothetical protein